MTDIDMQECTLSNVDEMMQSAMVQRQIEGASYMTVLPKVMNNSVIEFEINNQECFLELNKTEVEVKYRIKKSDGTNLTAEDHVGTINYPIASLFSSVEVKLNNKTITYGSSNYAERAIMEVLMTYNHDALKSWLSAGHFVKDTAGRMDAADPNAADNVVNHGLKRRAQYSRESRLVTVRGKLHEDLFNQPRPLPKNNSLYIRFTRNKDQYCLMSNVENASYKIDIEEMSLHVRKIYVTDQVKNTLAGQQFFFPLTVLFKKNLVYHKVEASLSKMHFIVVRFRSVWHLLSCLTMHMLVATQVIHSTGLMSMFKKYHSSAMVKLSMLDLLQLILTAEIFWMDIGVYYEQQTRDMQMQVHSFNQMSIKKEGIPCGHTIYHHHSVMSSSSIQSNAGILHLKLSLQITSHHLLYFASTCNLIVTLSLMK